MSEKLSIKLKILERSYPLSVNWEDEEKLRNASKRVNDLILRFKQSYTNKDNQDLLAMVCLQLAGKLLDLENIQENNTLDSQLNAMCEDLDEFIKLNQ